MSTWPPLPPDLPPPPAGPPLSPDRRYDSRRSYDSYSSHDPYRDPYGRERYPMNGDPDWDRRRMDRGRSRSPDDGRRKRRRSISPPYGGDRYDPRPRYDDDYRGRPRSPYRGSGRIPDPYSSDTPVAYRVWTEWLQANRPEEYAQEEAADHNESAEKTEGAPQGLKAAYEKYRKVMFCNQISVMFDYHRKSPWFNERYNPEKPYVNLRSRVRRQGWNGLVDKFITDLEGAKFDPSSKTASQPSQPEDDAPVPEDDDEKMEEAHEDAPNEDETADKPNGNANSLSKPDLRDDEVAIPPEGNQVLIRTIPPDIGRVMLEKALRGISGFRYLALGDTMQKRNYYRAAWIRFEDDADMTSVVNTLTDTKIEGFKLHATHSVRPFVAKVRFTPHSAARPERIEKDLAAARKLAGVLEKEALALSQLPTELPEVGGPEVETTEATEKPKDGGEDVDMQEIASSLAAPSDRGSLAVEQRLEKIYAELPAEQADDVAKKNEIALDLYCDYLRAAFNCCYYCAAVTDHVEELQRKCIKHIRRPWAGGDVIRDERWEDTLDLKIACLTDRDSVNPVEVGGRNYDDELVKAVEPHVKQEDEGKFRCKTCNKLFKAMGFVQKHIASKHSEHIKSLEEVPFLNNFAYDPHKIQPFSHAPPVTGNGQQAPPEAYGLRALPRREASDSYRPRGGYPPSGDYRGGSYYDYPPRYDYPPPRGYDSRGGYPPPSSRKLSERLGDYAPDGYTGMRAYPDHLPMKPVGASLDDDRGGIATRGTPMAPPANVREDPRAMSGRKVNYNDIDRVAEGDVELSY